MFNNQPLVCVTCGYVGKPQKTTKGNTIIELILWLFFLIPGLIYSIWRLSSKYDACPKCKGASMIPADSPIGQKVINEHKDALGTNPVEKYQIESKKENSRNTKIATIVIGFIVIMVAISAYTGQESSQEAVTSASVPIAETTKSTSTISTGKEEPLNYEVIQKMPGGTTLVMRVYTTEKESEKLIKLTDKLFNENKKGLTHLTIEYFDDKELATSYFNKLSDDSISDAEKDKMFTHYIASLVYNTTSGYKALKMNQDNSWVELKKY